ncbi:MAG TPA: hypothetical protein VGZ02_00015, partial [Candidatus Baltobacteraceae bacterium]|nr:hypothetical protein [Candidatus Baltobacteraceae bacterium]
MNPPSNARFCALLVLVAVAACASPSATTSLPFGARTVAGKSTQRPVLYVSETHSNAVYTFDPANIAAGPAGKITAGINRPGALAVGPDGVLYVTNTFGNNVTLYKAGATSPFRTIASTFGVPERVAVSADNTLAIAYTKGFRKSGELVIYDKGSATPT